MQPHRCGGGEGITCGYRLPHCCVLDGDAPEAIGPAVVVGWFQTLRRHGDHRRPKGQEHVDEVEIPARLGNGPVEGEVAGHRGCRVIPCGIERCQGVVQYGDVLRSSAGRCERRSFAFQTRPEGEQRPPFIQGPGTAHPACRRVLFSSRRGERETAAPPPRVNQPLGLETRERLAHYCPAHAELSDQGALTGQLLARGYGAVDDTTAKAVDERYRQGLLHAFNADTEG